MYRFGPILISIFLLAGCAGRGTPDAVYTLGDLLDSQQFDQGFSWEQRTAGDVSVGVAGSAYAVQTNVSSYVRGFDRASDYADVVIEADAVQLSAANNNAYGIVCRAAFDSDSADGYYFLIGGDGTYSIRKGERGDILALVAWEPSGAVNQGAASNQIRAVCVGDYLALYVNDRFVADTRDATYQRGRVGFAAATEAGVPLEVIFDNLTIFSAVLHEESEAE
ncbi:MAG: hypothetical protein ACOCX3_00925 [Chloroflexota bacterium]